VAGSWRDRGGIVVRPWLIVVIPIFVMTKKKQKKPAQLFATIGKKE
jgi:hypothetical protein